MAFDLAAALVAGFFATAIMTTLLYLSLNLGMARTDLPLVLGSLLTGPGPTAYLLGMLLHLGLGLLFGLAYAALFVRTGAGAAAGGLIGLGHGAIIGLLLGLICRLRPGPEAADPSDCPGLFGARQGYENVRGLFVLHAVFGMAMGILYRGLANPPPAAPL